MSKVQWLGDIQSCLTTCDQQHGAFSGNWNLDAFNKCVSSCYQASPNPPQAQPQAQPQPNLPQVVDCPTQCAGKLGVEYLTCLTACALQTVPAQPPPPAAQPPQQIPPTTPISPPPSCPAGQVLVNGQCVPNASSITKPEEDKGLPWGWILGGVAVVGGLAWLAMKSGGMAANPSERRYQVRFLPYIGSPYAKGKTGRVEKELPTLEQARAFMRKLKEPSSLIEDAELLEYTRAGWGGWGRRTIDIWDDKMSNANPRGDEPYRRSVGSSYGAPMGRRSDQPSEFVGKANLQRVPFVDGDYDPGGAYWGGGRGTQPLFAAWDEEGHEIYLRASSRGEAKAKLESQGIRFKR